MDIVERQSDYYDSVYLADYYESLWTNHPALEDLEVYWRYFKRQVTLKPKSQQGTFCLLDLGTGTGRVIHSLINKFADSTLTSGPHVKFVGVDKSQFMLEKASEAGASSSSIDLSFTVGTATALQDLEPSMNISEASVDLLIFAFSGINHLSQPGEVQQFFSSVQHILRAGGLAMISVCTPLLDVTDTYLSNPYGKVKEVKSSKLNGILYREKEIGQKVDGSLFINSLKTEVIHIGSDGSEKIVERNNHDIPLRLLTREELRVDIAGAGLILLGEEVVHEEVIFVVKKADI